MPTTSITTNVGVGPSSVSFRIPVEKGRLKAVSIAQVSGYPTYGGLAAYLSLAMIPAAPGSIVAHLNAGVFTQYQSLGWTGDIPLSPGLTVYARARTLGLCEVKMTVITEL